MTTIHPRSLRTLRTVPVLVLAVAVVLIGLAGSATAAKLITGKQVKNGSITSIDVRNNNLTGADIKHGTVSGSDLKDGTVGGADLHPDAVTYGFGTSKGDLDVPNCPDQTLSICPTLSSFLPNGPTALTVTGTLDSAGNKVPTPVRCGLVHAGKALDTVRFSPHPPR